MKIRYAQSKSSKQCKYMYIHVHVYVHEHISMIADLMSELEKERSDHRDQVASLHTHLSAAEDQIK